VVVAALADAGALVGIEDALYPVEQFLADERFMPAAVLDALVGDPAEVVAVPQQRAQGLDRDQCHVA
jgi:hypothetical protein